MPHPAAPPALNPTPAAPPPVGHGSPSTEPPLRHRDIAVADFLNSEPARAEELAAVNRELGRRNRLLAAAARAGALLSARADFVDAVVEALGLVADAAEFDRIVVVEHLGARGRPDAEFWRVSHAWHRPGIVSQLASSVFGGSFADTPMFLAEMREHDRVIEFATPEIPDAAFRHVQETLGARLLVAGNIFIDGFSWGAFACDDCTTARRRRDEEKRGIAAAIRAIGQAIHRRRLEQRAESLHLKIPTGREEAATHRTGELAALNLQLAQSNRLLAAAARALKGLLSARDLAPAVTIALGIMGETANMHRVKVILQRPATGDTGSFHELAHEWWTPELSSQASLGLTHFPDDLIDVYLQPLRSGQSIWQMLDEVPAALREPFRQVGMQSMGIVPIFAGTDYIGLVAFDDCKRRRVWSPTEIEALTIAAGGLGSAIQRERLQNEKIEAVALERAAAESGRQTAVQAERNRMARDIHDTLAQSFTGILLQLEAADLLREQGDPRAAERYKKIRAQAQLGLAETRRTALALAPEALNEGLLPALTQLCQRSHVEERMRCTFTYEGLARRLDAAREERLLRVAKEALSNAVRHGRATEVILHLAFAPAEVTLSITDNGVGFTVSDSTGLGLTNMRAALAEAGGALRVASAPAAGTTITATVPLVDPPSAKHPIAPPLQES